MRCFYENTGSGIIGVRLKPVCLCKKYYVSKILKGLNVNSKQMMFATTLKGLNKL